ncbi:MAG: response regulator [Bryobacterales bacterium]|nr:response regulator [Bryobacterales bacterium]
MTYEQPARRRILVIDDNEAIHDDLRKILTPPERHGDDLDGVEALLFGSTRNDSTKFQVDSAYQGQDGLKLVEAAWQEGRPYEMAFVDVRMPPGWDGIETTTRLWRCDPSLQIVICTAYTDYSWREIVDRLGESHNFVILKKPFDNIEVVQLAHALTSKRAAIDVCKAQIQEVENEVRQRQSTERELLAALEAAESANRLKREFLATMSHELRTPLNAIIGYGEMLAEDARQTGGGQMLPVLDKVQMASRHLLNLINDVLDMARIEAGKMPIRSESVSARELAGDALAIAEPLAQKRGNRLVLKISEEPLWMEVDQTRFQQCLLNLLSNACKFTSAGSVELAVVRNGMWMEWSVRDTGIGISAENLGKLFEPFTQVDSAATRRFGGSGLGLAISRRLCELMGGSLTAQSELGKGSTFTIRIPSAVTSGSSDPSVPVDHASGGSDGNATVPPAVFAAPRGLMEHSNA